MRDVMTEVKAWLANGDPVAGATVISTWGSAPRPAGSPMAISQSGAIAGSVSGGVRARGGRQHGPHARGDPADRPGERDRVPSDGGRRPVEVRGPRSLSRGAPGDSRLAR